MSDQIVIGFSPSARLDDLRALLESYGVEVLKDGLIWQSCPLYACAIDQGQGWSNEAIPVIDNKIEARLVEYERVTGCTVTGIRGGEKRWPFWVESPLSIFLRVGDQWWEYRFSPGKTYEERSFTGVSDTATPAETGTKQS